MLRVAFGRRLNEVDRKYADFERDGGLNVAMSFLFVLDDELHRADLLAALARLGDTMPRFRQRLLAGPLLPPIWSPAAPIDVEDHLSVVDLPAGSGVDDVLERGADLHATSFAPDRPPWNAVYFAPLAGGRSALFLRLHHSMGDGITAFSAFQTAFGTGGPLLESYETDRERSTTEQTIRSTVECFGRAGRSVLRMVRGLVHGPSRRAVLAEARAYASPPPPGRIGNTTRAQQLAGFTVPLPVWQRRAGELGGRFNDLYLKIASAATAEYWRRAGKPQRPCLVAMPVNARVLAPPGTIEDGCSGATIGMVRIDPAESADTSLAAIIEKAGAARTAAMRPGATPVVAPLLAPLPSFVRRNLIMRMFAKTDVVASNPGTVGQLWVGPAPVSALWAVAPAIGCLAAFILVTYQDRVHLTVNVDAGLVDDVALFRECVASVLDEVFPASWSGAPPP